MQTEAQLFKALADETRLKILFLLMEQKELCVTDFTAILDIAQPRASRHLRTLYHAGLVVDRRDRLCVYYRISAAPGSRQHKLLQVLREMLAVLPVVKTLRREMQKWLGMSSYPTSRKGGPALEPQP
jgi:ArsR family transcriptional regulator, arsenate/arsenite/antimonite-responsive transcriptional repressor